MTNDNIQLSWHDQSMERILLKRIPRSLTPNHFTILRLLLTPFVLYFVWSENWKVAVPLFLFTIFTDAIDGSMARMRKQITVFGTVADPMADKLLIGSVVLIFVTKEISLTFAAVILSIELLIVVRALILRKKRGAYFSATRAGKIKMVLQCIGVTVLLLAQWSGQNMLVMISIGSLSLAILFALISLFGSGL